ncbi:MAG: O-antigen ligase family protein [Bacteroidia bacterium]|nr:O-antigen ligase family protein [Bacteroidia bacterium]
MKKHLLLHPKSLLQSPLNVWCFVGLNTLSLIAAIGFEMPFLLIIPILILIALQAVVNYIPVFYLLIALTPVSVEYSFSPTLGMDLPTEPLMIGLTGLYCLSVFIHFRHPNIFKILRHPFIVLLSIHFTWAILVTAYHGFPLISIKWILAKSWFFAVCIGLGVEILKNEKAIQKLFWILMPLFMFTIIWVTFRHSDYHFSFSHINDCVKPFYRNHVNYAVFVALCLPYFLYLFKVSPLGAGKILAGITAILSILAILLAYTRAAYLAVLVAVLTYPIIHFRYMKHMLFITGIGAITGLGYLIQDNRFLSLAPDYSSTISHTNFDDLITATAQGKDISSMERIQRWVAGGRMIADKPLLGFGPNQFNQNYKQYGLARFYTYVSNNIEQSSVHCYPLTLAIEQGLPAMILWLTLCAAFLLYAEKYYHETTNQNKKRLIMAVACAQIVILTCLLVNDLVETDKIGIFFFLNFAMMMNLRTQPYPFPQ